IKGIWRAWTSVAGGRSAKSDDGEVVEGRERVADRVRSGLGHLDAVERAHRSGDVHDDNDVLGKKVNENEAARLREREREYLRAVGRSDIPRALPRIVIR